MEKIEIIKKKKELLSLRLDFLICSIALKELEYILLSYCY